MLFKAVIEFIIVQKTLNICIELCNAMISVREPLIKEESARQRVNYNLT